MSYFLDLKLLLVIQCRGHTTKNGTPDDAMMGDTNCLSEGEVDDCVVLRYAVQSPSSWTARPADRARGEVMQFQHFIVVWHTLQVTEPAQSTLHQGDCDGVLFSLLSNSAVSYMVIMLTFSSRRRQLMSKAMNRLQSRMVMFHVSEPYSNTEETRAQYILIFVCREMQRSFHSALESFHDTCCLANTGSDFCLNGTVGRDDTAEVRE